MSDIVTWLREDVEDIRGEVAADEIETLRQRVNDAEARGVAYAESKGTIHAMYDNCMAELAELRKELKSAQDGCNAHLENHLKCLDTLAELRKAQGVVAYYEIETPDGIKWVGSKPTILANHTSKPLYYSPPVAAQGEPVAYGLLMPNGELDTELVGSKEDCEFWTRADGERQSGWQIVELYTSPPAIPEGWQPVTFQAFNEWMHRELPSGTIIGDAGWWASRIYKHFIALSAAPKP